MLANLRKLDVSHNSFGDEGVRHLSEALASRDGVLANLEELDFSRNSVGAKGLQHLSAALSSRRGRVLANLRVLDVELTSISSSDRSYCH